MASGIGMTILHPPHPSPPLQQVVIFNNYLSNFFLNILDTHFGRVVIIHVHTISLPVDMYLLMPDVNYYFDFNGENTSTLPVVVIHVHTRTRFHVQ
jgi:hypothetical protein